MGKPRNVIDIDYHIANWLKREETHKEQTQKNREKLILTHVDFSKCVKVEHPDKAFVGDCWLIMYHGLNNFNFVNFGSLIFLWFNSVLSNLCVANQILLCREKWFDDKNIPKCKF